LEDTFKELGSKIIVLCHWLCKFAWVDDLVVKLKQFLLWVVPTFIISFMVSKFWFDPTMQAILHTDYWKSVLRFGEALRVTNTQYVDENKSQFQDLTDYAISGMVTNLDRHSSYYTSTEYELFKEDTHRRYVGIGVMIRKVEDGVLITRVFEGGSAEGMGLVAGDYIVKVDDQEIEGWGLSKVSSQIKGEDGTKVSLTLRTTFNKIKKVSVTRKKISISSVEGSWLDENGTGYVRLVQFTANSGSEFKNAISGLLQDGMKRMVLDLRDNSGGLLSAAVEVSDIFLPKDQLIVSIKGRENTKIREYRCQEDSMLPNLPVVILMNEGSASASEIVGGALSVLGRAKVFGENSFGKGSVQTIFPTENRTGLRLTTAMYFLPDGSTIHEKGVTPDYLVECSDENETKLRTQRYSLRMLGEEDFKQKFGFFPIEDVQLREAKQFLSNQLDYMERKNK
jgi:carboxyl-terminal processing protease